MCSNHSCNGGHIGVPKSAASSLSWQSNRLRGCSGGCLSAHWKCSQSYLDWVFGCHAQGAATVSVQVSFNASGYLLYSRQLLSLLMLYNLPFCNVMAATHVQFSRSIDWGGTWLWSWAISEFQSQYYHHLSNHDYHNYSHILKLYVTIHRTRLTKPKTYTVAGMGYLIVFNIIRIHKARFQAPWSLKFHFAPHLLKRA